MLCGKPCAGLLKGSRVKLVHKFDLCSLVLLQAEPVASAAAPSSNRGAPGFGVVVRVDTRLIARHSGGSVLGKASASTEEVGGFVIWYVQWGSHHLRLLSCVCSWKRCVTSRRSYGRARLENRAAAQKLQSALSAAAETCRTTQSSLAARRNRASTSSKSTAGVRKFVSRVRNRGDTGTGVALDVSGVAVCVRASVCVCACVCVCVCVRSFCLSIRLSDCVCACLPHYDTCDCSTPGCRCPEDTVSRSR